MLFINTYKKNKLCNNIITVFDKTFLIKKRYFLYPHYIDLYFPDQKLALEFNSFYSDSKKKFYEENNIKIFDVSNTEEFTEICGRLLYVLNKINQMTLKT